MDVPPIFENLGTQTAEGHKALKSEPCTQSLISRVSDQLAYSLIAKIDFHFRRFDARHDGLPHIESSTKMLSEFQDKTESCKSVARIIYEEIRRLAIGLLYPFPQLFSIHLSHDEQCLSIKGSGGFLSFPLAVTSDKIIYRLSQ
jgi:hypothetical protein